MTKSSKYATRPCGGLWRDCRKMLAVFNLGVRRRLSQPGELFARAGFLGMMLFVFDQLWRAVARHGAALPGGYDHARLVWYLAFADAIMISTSFTGEPPLDREVRNGDIAYRIARPLDYPLYQLSASLGDRVLRVAATLSCGSAFAWLLTRTFPFDAWAIAAGTCATALALVLDELVTLTLSLSAFWLENTFGLHLLYRRCALLLGGALIPLSAYPEWLARVCRVLPFRYVAAGPAQQFLARDASGFAGLAALQLGCAACVGLALFTIYRFGLRRVIAQGG